MKVADVSDDRLLLVNGYHQRDKSLIKYGGSWCQILLPPDCRRGVCGRGDKSNQVYGD